MHEFHLASRVTKLLEVQLKSVKFLSILGIVCRLFLVVVLVFILLCGSLALSACPWEWE